MVNPRADNPAENEESRVRPAPVPVESYPEMKDGGEARRMVNVTLVSLQKTLQERYLFCETNPMNGQIFRRVFKGPLKRGEGPLIQR
jgi:hypothetical protein